MDLSGLCLHGRYTRLFFATSLSRIYGCTGCNVICVYFGIYGTVYKFLRHETNLNGYMFRSLSAVSSSFIASLWNVLTKSIKWIISEEGHMAVFLLDSISSHDRRAFTTAVVQYYFNQNLAVDRGIQNLPMVNTFKPEDIQFPTSPPSTLPLPILSPTIFISGEVAISCQILSNSMSINNHISLAEDNGSPPSAIHKIFFPQNTFIPEEPTAERMGSAHIRRCKVMQKDLGNTSWLPTRKVVRCIGEMEEEWNWIYQDHGPDAWSDTVIAKQLRRNRSAVRGTCEDKFVPAMVVEYRENLRA